MMMKLDTFIDKYRNDARKIDLYSENKNVFEVLQSQKNKLNDATFDSDVKEVAGFAENAVKELKSKLRRTITNKVYLTTHVNHTPPFLIYVRLYIEYLDLYDRATKRPTQKPKSELTMPKIALIYAYRGEFITRDNANGIAHENGYNSKLSGEKLYQEFIYYIDKRNRTQDEDTERKLKNKIKLLESVVPHLPKDSIQKAKDEISILKQKL